MNPAFFLRKGACPLFLPSTFASIDTNFFYLIAFNTCAEVLEVKGKNLISGLVMNLDF
jgi:hypothetical protein